MPKIWVDKQGRVHIPRPIRELVGIGTRTYINYNLSDASIILKAKKEVKKK